MNPCKFVFDDSPVFDGFSHDSTWNSFDNVAVTASERERIAAWFKESSIEGGEVATQEVADLMAIEPIEVTDPPLYSLGWGYATQIVCERADKPLPADAAGMIAAWFVVTLHKWLDSAEWNGMLARNAKETDPHICHSHDYCDANMAMAEAFKAITGREPDGDDADDADNILWSKAWDIAMPTLGRKR